MSRSQQQIIAPCIPIVFGNTAESLPPTGAAGAHTHKWSVYVRSGDGQDLSKIFKKVVFKLHESFHKPTRTISVPPYEVSESGWGEFEIQATIHLMDPAEPSLTLYHFLKLYADPAVAGKGTLLSETPTGAEVITAESYDEIVFPSASPVMSGVLKTHLIIGNPRVGARNYDEEERNQLAAIEAATSKLDGFMADAEKDMADVDGQYAALRSEIQLLEKATART